MPQTRETKTPYGTIFRSGDREWFPGSVEEFRTAKAWAESRVKTMTLERAREIGAPQGVAQCSECGAYLPIHEGYLNAPCPESGCGGVLSVEVGVE
jgi:hypothetical protein